MASFLQLDEDQHRPRSGSQDKLLQRALANGKRRPAPWTNMVSEYLDVLLPFLL